MKRPICTILCILTLLGFSTMFVQEQWKPFKMKPLNGFTAEAQKPSLTLANFASGDFQNKAEDYIGDHFGFREFFIRLYNQFSYSCFRQINNDNIKEGRNHELYLKMYLDEITGKRLKNDFGSVEKAKTIAQQNVEETLRLIDTLHSHGTKFLFVFAPSKTWVYPENMPKAYRDHIIDFSLEDYYIQLFKENHIPHIDFLNYFKSIKDTATYPLYPRTGTHWAESIIPFVADSIMKKLESITAYDLPSVKYIDENLTTDYSVQDGELEASMNLLFPLKKPAIPKPVFALTDTIGADKPNLLVIGDSYFTQLRISPFVNAFNHWDVWVYNRDVNSSRNAYNWKELKQVYEAPKILKEADIVMAIFTAPMLYNYMFGFTQTAQELYQKTPLQITIDEIKANAQWMQAIKKQAAERGLTFEENLQRNARYTLETRLKKQQTNTEQPK